MFPCGQAAPSAGPVRQQPGAEGHEPGRPSHIGPVELSGDPVLGVQKAVEPDLLLPSGDGVRHLRRRGAGTGGVDEGETL